ncbi:MAG TPA: NAD(P)H-dependent oxidoreductase [Limnochordia bacterium]|jgi:chromate reductase|nr:NAD(P)H-dependent oxidoreductase [Bacillota bacterium]HOB09726.1 NAD(P)H-dependent oxidoreductase [Limnochordia bacterium]NLH32121.1 NAD(P)H-dependent oxidoreductase [Bacillota bacterium]HPT93826.1 NAD(P)H-dependent oxidoreductase [Limnochordia bacterium]HPZ31640.1 NAD(P)H-dependent oxidoreductase [Limnochordia bacterium]
MAKIGIVVGSLRKGSFSKKVAENVAKLFPDGYTTEIIEIGNLPLYNQDYDADSPAEYTAFRSKVREVDAVLFVTPEHNRSIPSALKNALDVASRPWGQNVWAGKPAAIISQSIGSIGGFGANHHLRQVLMFLDMPVLQQPEVYLGNSADLFDANGSISSRDTLDYLQSFVDAFVALIRKYSS